MNEEYYTVDQVANMLTIHPKTIQRYIREGKLHASKIGKSWRISGHDLSLFIDSDRYEASNNENRRSHNITGSSVIDITTFGKSDALQIMNILTGAMNSKPAEYGQSSMHIQYIEQNNIVRITLWGQIHFMSAMMAMISTLAESNSKE